MLFNSYEFIIIFLPVIFVIYLILVKNDYVTLSRYWIVLSSIFFYGWWNILYVPIIVGSLIFNYLVSRYLYNGTISSYNIDKKKLLVFGIATNLLLLIFYKYVDFIAGMELGAVPLAAALSLETGIPYSMIRKSDRKHGTGTRLEGPSKGRAVIVDDVATTGRSNVESIKILTDAGAVVLMVLVVVDREEGATENLSPFDLEYKSLIPISDLVN